MSDGAIFAIFAVCMAVLVIIVGFVGNKIVDKSSDVIRNRAVRRKNDERPNEPESLADRYKQGPM